MIQLPIQFSSVYFCQATQCSRLARRQRKDTVAIESSVTSPRPRSATVLCSQELYLRSLLLSPCANLIYQEEPKNAEMQKILFMCINQGVQSQLHQLNGVGDADFGMVLQKTFCLLHYHHSTPSRITHKEPSTLRIKSKSTAASNPIPVSSSPAH